PIDKYRDGDKVVKTQQQVNEVTGIMHSAIGGMIDNQHKVSDLQEKSEVMDHNAKNFTKQTKDIKRRMCMRNAKITILIIVVILILLAIILVPTLIHVTKGRN
ncbi:hypothetical protein SAMD00019534_030730, partial [Acytostelium subglobosum LB1]|uniref:hypothetical protein n=1 Tax=Acytostelium subglobosum LB1 TaxID=1410327 RepID=UPI000644F4A3